MTKDELNLKAKQSIKEGDEDMVREVLEEAAAEGITAVELLEEGFGKAMEELGEEFAEGELFLPELIIAAEAMKIVTDKVDEEMEAGAVNVEKKGAIVIGTVKDDVHDIGKTICASMLKAGGFDVYDLGKQVPLQDYIDKAKEVGADIIGTSALLTTTMEHQRTIEKMLAEEGLKGKIKTMVGGAPVSQGWADTIGADGYSNDAITCVAKATELAAK